MSKITPRWKRKSSLDVEVVVAVDADAGIVIASFLAASPPSSGTKVFVSSITPWI